MLLQVFLPVYHFQKTIDQTSKLLNIQEQKIVFFGYREMLSKPWLSFYLIVLIILLTKSYLMKYLIYGNTMQ